MNKTILALAMGTSLVAGGATAANPVVTAQSGQYSIGINGFVPVICRATVGSTSVPTTGTSVDLGGLNEFCNNANGYEVYADYAPALASATLIIDGKKVNLSRDGSTRISQSNKAAIANHSIALDLSKTRGTAGSISFRIVAL
jgi:hypothetical protein